MSCVQLFCSNTYKKKTEVNVPSFLHSLIQASKNRQFRLAGGLVRQMEEQGDEEDQWWEDSLLCLSVCSVCLLPCSCNVWKNSHCLVVVCSGKVDRHYMCLYTTSHFNVRMDSDDRGPVTAQRNVNPYKGYIRFFSILFLKYARYAIVLTPFVFLRW